MSGSIFSQVPRDNSLLDKRNLGGMMRSLAVQAGGKVFHLLISGGNQNLHQTASDYIQKTGTRIVLSSESRGALEEFTGGGRGIILLNHDSGIISDYLPLIALLGEQVVDDTIYYTGAWNEKMNQKAFPKNDFRAATMHTRTDATVIKQNIKNDIAVIDNVGGYIFAVAPGTNTERDAPFQAVAQQLIKHSPSNMPILLNHITQKGEMGYMDIAKHFLDKKGKNIDISSRLIHASDLKSKTGQEMREYFNQITAE